VCTVVHDTHEKFFSECFRSQNISTLIGFSMNTYGIRFFSLLHRTFCKPSIRAKTEVGNFVKLVSKNRRFFFLQHRNQRQKRISEKRLRIRTFSLSLSHRNIRRRRSRPVFDRTVPAI